MITDHHTLEEVRNAVALLAKVAGEESRARWGTQPIDFVTHLCLIHSEISEALEAYRCGAQDSKIPTRRGEEVELADALLRICLLAYQTGYDLPGAVCDKIEYNASRKDHSPEARAGVGGKKF